MSKPYPEELFCWMDAADDDDAPDGAWGAMLQDSVSFYNEEHGTHYDPHEAWLAWVESRGQ